MIPEVNKSERQQPRVQVVYHVEHGNTLVLDVNWDTKEKKAVFRNEFNQDSFINAPYKSRVTIRQVLQMRLVDMHHVSVNDIMIPRSWEWNKILDSPVETVEMCQLEIWSYMAQVGEIEHAG